MVKDDIKKPNRSDSNTIRETKDYGRIIPEKTIGGMKKGAASILSKINKPSKKNRKKNK